MTSATAVRERAVSRRAIIVGHGSSDFVVTRLAGTSRMRSPARPVRVVSVIALASV
jgi:hypothetical protein